MSASEEPNQDQELAGGAEEDRAARPAPATAGAEKQEPLFLRGRSDGDKGNAQDEKDEMGE